MSVNFLSDYMHPKERKAYICQSSVEIMEIAPPQASTYFSVEEVPSQDDVAHDENVGEWADCVTEIMSLWGCDRYTFNQLVSLSNLSSGRVFLALFLGNRFELSRGESFYHEIAIECL